LAGTRVARWCHRRWHKIGNVLNALPKSPQPGAKKALAEIWNAEDKDHAQAAANVFAADSGNSWTRPTRRLTSALERTRPPFRQRLPSSMSGRQARHRPVIATSWEITPAGPTQRETATINGDAFAFTGPLPATFGLTVATTGDPTILGPDFRSASLTAASLPPEGAVRVEFVLGPLVRFEQPTSPDSLRRSRPPPRMSAPEWSSPTCR
jgi:hypothetical protein